MLVIVTFFSQLGEANIFRISILRLIYSFNAPYRDIVVLWSFDTNNNELQKCDIFVKCNS